MRTVDRDGDRLAAMVYVDNARSKRLVTVEGWMAVSTCGDHELWIGRL
ncbi:MAG: hypothetical protein ACRD0U_18030 [Acidimicrobiales bacterium]